MELEVRYVHSAFDIVGYCSAHDYKWDENFVFNGEAHDLWEIVCVTEGAVEVTEDEKVYSLSAGDMILHAPLEFHRIRSSRGTSPSLYVISFKSVGELSPRLRDGVFSLDEGYLREYSRIFKKISTFLADTDAYADFGYEAAALLKAFLISLGRYGEAESRISNVQSALEYQKAVRLMTEGVCENLTLAEIAAKSYISVSYMKLLFKKYAGISPKSYYSNLRVQYAAALLRDGASVESVAERMNFSSPNYFSVFFKQRSGKTPSEYRRDAINGL